MKRTGKPKKQLLEEIKKPRTQFKKGEKRLRRDRTDESEVRARSNLQGSETIGGPIERSEVERRLLESNERMVNILESISDGFFSLDNQMVVTYFNRAAERLLGRPRTKVLGKKLSDAFPEGKGSIFERNYAEAIRDKKPMTFEVHFNVKPFEGWYEVRVFPFKDGISVYFQVTTERKEIEKKLAHLASFPELNPNPVVEVSFDGCIHYLNPAAQKLFLDLQERDRRHEWLADLKSIGSLSKAKEKTFHVREIHADGVWFEQFFSFMHDQDRIRIYGRDITERKRAEEAMRTAEELARQRLAEIEGLYRNAPVGLCVLDRELRWVRINERLAEINGIPAADHVGKRVRDLMPELADAVEPEMRRVMETGQPRINIEIISRTPAQPGVTRSWKEQWLPITDAHGQATGMSIVVEETTESKRGEESLRKSKEKFELLSETASKLLATDQPQKVVDELCQKVMEHLDCQAFFNYLVDEGTQRLHLNAYGGIPEETGKEIEWLDYGVAVCGCAARDACRIVAEDIPNTPDPRTDLVKSFGIKAYACHPLSSEGRVMGTLSFGTRLRGTFDEEELSLMKTVADQVAIAMERMKLYENGQRLLGEIKKSRDELEVRIQGRTQELASAVDTLRDEVRERMKAEEALIASSRHVRSLIEASLDPLVTISADGKVTDVNRATELVTGVSRENLIGSDFSMYFTEPEKAREGYETVFSKGTVRDYPLAIRHTSGVFTDVLYNATIYKNEAGEVQGIFAAARDISEQKKAEQALRNAEDRLRQMQKMEALGTLAGGIAHDFNNILMPILINTELALFDVPPESPVANSLHLVLSAANRGKEMVKQITTFSRMKVQERRPVKIATVVKEALTFLNSSLPKHIEIRDEIRAESSMVAADPTQIQQVLMNLCGNAADAMRENGGLLRVTLEEMFVSESMVSMEPGLRVGPYVQLTVSDTGTGISPDVMEKVFDPFFTTKDPAGGTGMGLPMVHGIVKSHGGVVTALSEMGKGSVFKVFLPRVETDSANDSPDESPIPTGKETILVVDDEEFQVQSMKQMLGRLGYHVSGETRSLEALELFRTQPQQFDLVITDEVMPVMTGSNLAQELLKIRSDLPIILCTGYSEAISADKVRKIGIRELMMKPFGIREIARTMRKVLDARPD